MYTDQIKIINMHSKIKKKLCVKTDKVLVITLSVKTSPNKNNTFFSKIVFSDDKK